MRDITKHGDVEEVKTKVSIDTANIMCWFSRLALLFSCGALFSFLCALPSHGDPLHPLRLDRQLLALTITIIVLVFLRLIPLKRQLRIAALVAVLLCLLLFEGWRTFGICLLVALVEGAFVNSKLPDKAHGYFKRHKQLAHVLAMSIATLICIEAIMHATGWVVAYNKTTINASDMQSKLRIICLGDSFTEGMGASRRDLAWPSVLSRKLESSHTQLKPEVTNLGLRARNSSTCLKRLRESIALSSPHVVLVCCGVNNRWNLKDIDPTLYSNMSYLQQWHAQAVQLTQRSSIIKLFRLARFSLVPDIKPSSGTFELSRLGLVPGMTQWLGTPLVEEICEKHLPLQPETTRLCWALGLKLNQCKDASVFQKEYADRVDELYQLILHGQYDAVVEELELYSGFGKKHDAALFLCWQKVLKNESEAAASFAADVCQESPKNLALTFAACHLNSPTNEHVVQYIQFTILPYDRYVSTSYLHHLKSRLPQLNIEDRVCQLDPMDHFGIFQKHHYTGCEKPLEALRTLLTIDPEWHYVRYALAYRLLELRRFKEALPVFEELTEIMPQNPAFCGKYCYVLAYCERREEALRAMEKALRLGIDPNMMRIWMINLKDAQFYRDALDGMIARMPQVRENFPHDTKRSQYLQQNTDLEILKKDLESIKALCDKNGAMLLIHAYPHPYKACDVLREYGMQNNCFLVDHLPVFQHELQTRSYDELYLYDGHCTDLGYGIMADNIYNALLPVIEEHFSQ
jgi:tetratricopeptide (TPR) repeat protein